MKPGTKINTQNQDQLIGKTFLCYARRARHMWLIYADDGSCEVMFDGDHDWMKSCFSRKNHEQLMAWFWPADNDTIELVEII